MSLSEKQKNHGSKLVGLTMIPGVQDCITEWTRVNGEYDEWQVELRVLRSLFSIPRGKKHYMILRGEQAQIAASFVSCGWTECGGPSEHGDTYRMLPTGRAAFLAELETMVDPSKPVKPQVDAIFAEQPR